MPKLRPQAKESNRRFLKQALEIVLTGLHVKACQYQESLAVAQPLIRELKKFDDKLQLVEVQLIESRACEDPPLVWNPSLPPKQFSSSAQRLDRCPKAVSTAAGSLTNPPHTHTHTPQLLAS